MFLARRHVRRNIFTPLPLNYHQPRPVLPSTCRWAAATVKLTDEDLVTSTPLAESLLATGTWASVKARNARRKSSESSDGDDDASSKPKTTGKRKTAKSKPAKDAPKPLKGESSRVNIVSAELCDDILSYIGPTLKKRHKGCDILDIYPGAGLWSRKLNDYLKPRSHIMMEPDAEFYKPFMKTLLKRPGTTIVPKSGIVWQDLYSVLTPEYFPHQTVRDQSERLERNDTLLVTANIAFHPKKRYKTFESIAQLLLHQFIDAIRTGAMFQKYGLVRMLIWSRSEEKTSLLPKSLQKRKRGALEAEMGCEWIYEVCGHDGPDSVWYTRESAMDTHRTLSVLKKMKAAGMEVPAGRESESIKEAATLLEKGLPAPEPGSEPPTFKRAFQETLANLEQANEEATFDKGSSDYKVLRGYQWRESWETKKHERLYNLWVGLKAIMNAHREKKPSQRKIKELEKEWDENLDNYNQKFLDEFCTYRDNLQLYYQEPPVLHWDRRIYEPMMMQREEFLPNVDCSLIDIQPKAMHPMLRETGPKSTRAADSFDLVMATMLRQSTIPLSKALDGIWPGASDYIMPRFTSIKTSSPGGLTNHLRKMEATPRQLSIEQWEQLLELWMEWPFRPDFQDLLGRTSEEQDWQDEGAGGSVAAD